MMEADVVVENSPASAGSLLRKAREAKGMSLDDVAGKLKLSRRQIEALEADNFAELPGLTFVRGFVRNYARVLDIDPDPILAFLDAGPQTLAQLRAAEPPAEPKAPQLVKLPHRTGYPRTRRVPVKLIAGVVLAALLVGGGALLVHQASLEPELTLAPANPPAPPAAVVEAPKSEASVDASAAAPVVPAAPAETAASPVAAPDAAAVAATAQAAAPAAGETAKENAASAAAAAPAAADGTAQLRLAFEGDSWVDIRDADGKKVASKLYKPGAEDTLSGKPPFKLVIGNAAQVKLFYNGQPVDLAAHVKINVARLKLE